MPKVTRSRRDLNKPYVKQIANSEQVRLDRNCYTAIDTLIQKAVSNAVSDSLLVQGSSKLLTFEDLSTALSMTPSDELGETLDYARKAIESFKNSKTQHS